jgi:hypothetical protein
MFSTGVKVETSLAEILHSLLLKARKSDFCKVQPSHAHDSMSGDAGFMIRHKGNARQRQ